MTHYVKRTAPWVRLILLQHMRWLVQIARRQRRSAMRNSDADVSVDVKTDIQRLSCHVCCVFHVARLRSHVARLTSHVRHTFHVTFFMSRVHNREFSQIGNIDVNVDVDVESQPVGSLHNRFFNSKAKNDLKFIIGRFSDNIVFRHVGLLLADFRTILFSDVSVYLFIIGRIFGLYCFQTCQFIYFYWPILG